MTSLHSHHLASLHVGLCLEIHHRVIERKGEREREIGASQNCFFCVWFAWFAFVSVFAGLKFAGLPLQ